MASGHKCRNCGSADIEVDSARGDAVCTNCGSVLEDNIIVSEVQFEENAHGASNTVGQFVSADSKGGATVYGKFHVGVGTESREVTLKKAREGITHLCHQLHLNTHCIETSCNFFKMALNRHLTRGRKNSHIYAACVYITCRTEGTSHLLIDISDILQICCYELGRTYLRLSQTLCINIPSIDPCLYIMRFANKLEFGEKTHEVSMTAQRLVQRMKKDSIHTGRRPSGLCGAALLLAARMHEYNRTPMDVVRIVKIHESTLRKRLLEFGDTPSSALTLEEFMAVDLEAEQDPPAFKMARKRDKERIQKIAENEAEFTALQREIDAQLEKDFRKSNKKVADLRGDNLEMTATSDFIHQSTLDVINECLTEQVEEEEDDVPVQGIGPDIEAMCEPERRESVVDTGSLLEEEEQMGEDLVNLEDVDDDEINGYILSEEEARMKHQKWNELNAEYLKAMQAKEERLAKEREKGKPERKRRKVVKKKNIGPSNTAGEAIEKMLQEKKISTKINYDILKALTAVKPEEVVEAPVVKEEPMEISLPRRKKTKLTTTLSSLGIRKPRPVPTATLHTHIPEPEPLTAAVEENEPITEEPEDEPENETEVEQETEKYPEHSSLADMLNGDEEEYYGYDDY
ncbi:transcription factor IIIB 90 kDa subunit [Lutzomyia longipalpis]|uniref:transcription factor IIIB 90 kDa subunit n=1 Tax=Lutzomyia longipalpis TaxID=7200 RepID=UPI002483BA17|nr:transcription factor IIIB 90 kDa subunit [Lutzomyia longipalpis]